MNEICQWDVWWLDQPASRNQGFPPQPGDPSAKNRMMIVISRNSYLRANGRPTCVPIGSSFADSLIHVPLKNKEGGVLRECFVWCNEIYTIDRRYFLQKMGSLPKARCEEIKGALRSFLDLG